jgi:serine/tyrosine/threonine adenylyltransferase
MSWKPNETQAQEGSSIACPFCSGKTPAWAQHRRHPSPHPCHAWDKGATECTNGPGANQQGTRDDNRPMNAPEPLALLQAPDWQTDSFAQQMGRAFAVPQAAQALPHPHWVARNEGLAADLGWADWLHSPQALVMLSGGGSAPGTSPATASTKASASSHSDTQPPAPQSVATVYSGHQFGQWAGQLGDGRALLLGEAQTPLGRMEVQLKGSGLTPFSRMGDGRAVLRSSIREYLCSEAMHGLGIPTTRALALTGSALPVRRETIETAAVVTRVAPSFLRFGHFEHFTHTDPDEDMLKRLADATLARFYLNQQSAANPYAALLEAVTRRTAALMAQWQLVGFCHGVMNTDNMSMLGLTIDYGPFGFMDAFDPNHICNHSDHQGRYAWARQPNIGLWNLHALGQALMPLIGDSDAALAALEPYKTEFPRALLNGMRQKLGLRDEQENDRQLADDFMRLMAADHADFTITFRRLASFNSAAGASNDALRDMFIDRAAFDAWAQNYAARLHAENSVDAQRAARMNRVNPKFVLRNHLCETAITRAREGNFNEVQRVMKVLQRPFDEQPEHEADAGFPPDWASQLEVSCSS